MTTIATDGKTIAADGLRCAGAERIASDEKKIRMRGGVIFAFTGTAALFDPMIDWYLDGHKMESVPKAPDKDDGGSLLVIDHTGNLVKYSVNLPYPEPFPYPATFGSGCEFAMGALHHGASSAEAIRVACALNVYTGGEVIEVDIARSLAAGRLLPPVAATPEVPSAANTNGLYRGLNAGE